MQAIVFDRYGSPDVLRLEEVAKPEPRHDEVLIKIEAAAVNPWELDLLRGRPLLSRIGALRAPAHPILGADIAGVVESVGSLVTRFRAGDRVFGDISGCHWGGFAEYVCAEANVLARKPEDMSFAQAAALPQAGIMALRSLRFGDTLRAGHKLLINGAGGGVGTIGVQLAKSMGAEITAVDSAIKLARLRELGADHHIDYEQADYTRTGHEYDRIVDVVAKRSVAAYRRALRPEGVFVFVGGSAATATRVLTRGTWISRTSRQHIGVLMHKPAAADLDELGALFDAGRLVPVIDTIYPLRDTPQALRRLQTGDFFGKLVITMEDSA